MKTGRRFKTVELSSIDTRCSWRGVLFAQSYFDRDDAGRDERSAISPTGSTAASSGAGCSRGRRSSRWAGIRTKGMHTHDYKGYEEAMILYVLALGSPTHPDLAGRVAGAASSNYKWATFYGQEFINYAPALHPPVPRTSGSTSAASRTPTCARRGSTTSRTRGGRPTRSVPTPPPIRAGSATTARTCGG